MPQTHAPPASRPEDDPAARVQPNAKVGPVIRAQEPSQARAKRDNLRAAIVRAQEGEPPDAVAPAAPAANDDPDRPRTLKDRVGGRAALVGHLNRDFMPLARECIEQAHEQAPELAGMIAIGVEVIADEKLGAVVDVARIAPRNDVMHPGLLECIRETALSVTFPPPLVTGRELFELTLRVEPKPRSAPRP
jgi:hypothetical protein